MCHPFRDLQRSGSNRGDANPWQQLQGREGDGSDGGLGKLDGAVRQQMGEFSWFAWGVASRERSTPIPRGTI